MNYKKFLTLVLVILVSSVSLAQEKTPLNEESIFLSKQAKQAQYVYVPPAGHKILDHPFDIRKYSLDLIPSFSSRTLAGTAEIKAISRQAGLDSIDLNFVGNWAFTEVSINGQPADYNFSGEVLKISLPNAKKDGAKFSIKVSYNGRPTSETGENNAAFAMSSTWAFTFSQPFQARYWFPCFDEPSDKAEEGTDIRVTVPNSMQVASNGYLASVTSASSETRTHRWIHKYPIATYLVAVSINDYSMLTDNYKDIPMKWYVYPAAVTAASFDFARHDQMMQAFEDAFGEYPFDNYGVVMVPARGWAMEHQSMTTTSDVLVTGTRRYEMIMAHELAHMWWGDAVTLEDYREIWLNEGFASYAEAIWGEYLAGETGRDQVMEYSERAIRYQDERDRHSLYREDYNQDRMFSLTIYEKGAYVLHMLRWELGDEDFFKGLKAYYKKFKYKTVETQNFIDVMEEVSGKDLGGFFQSWVYGVAWPEYEISSYKYQRKGKTRAVITVHQKQTHDTVFHQTILIDPDGDGPLGQMRKKIQGKWLQFEVPVDEDADDAELVETQWLLMDASEADYIPPVAKKVVGKRLAAGKTHEVTIKGSYLTPATRLFVDSTNVKLKKVVIAEDGKSLVATIKVPKKAGKQTIGYRVVNPDGDTYTKKKGFRIIPAK